MEANQREELVKEMIKVPLFGEKGLCRNDGDDKIPDCLRGLSRYHPGVLMRGRQGESRQHRGEGR